VADLETVKIGKAEVEDDDLWILKGDLGQALLAGHRDDHFVTAKRQPDSQCLQ
jgi:hypothetical protein